MSYVDRLARGHERLIEENPIEVPIFRVERVREGGGFREIKRFIGLVRGRVYQEASGRAGSDEVTAVPGTLHIEARWGFLCPTTMLPVDPDTGVAMPGGVAIPLDVRAGAHVTDTFEHPFLGTFEITSVYPREDQGIVWGWACGAEVLS